jgi:hypothetical protein
MYVRGYLQVRENGRVVTIEVELRRKNPIERKASLAAT